MGASKYKTLNNLKIFKELNTSMVVFICSQGAYMLVWLKKNPTPRFPFRPFGYLASHRLDFQLHEFIKIYPIILKS